MHYIPYRKFTIELPNQPSDIEQRMTREIIRSQNNIKGFFQTYSTCFQGYAKEGKIFIHRKRFGNISMVPVVKGKISKNKNGGTIIELSVQYYSEVYVFLCMWACAVTLAFIASIIESVINLRFNIGIIISLFMFLSAYLMSMISFSIELETIKKFFNDQFLIHLK